MEECGILIGSDLSSEWLLPWWWNHYSQNNEYPIAFVDFGLSVYGREWCRQKGSLLSFESPLQVSLKEHILPEVAHRWEKRYGETVWSVREAWLKKPFSLSLTPFNKTIWLDTDCLVHTSLESLFKILEEYELAVYDDSSTKTWLTMFDSPHYNSGVIGYQKNTPFLSQLQEVVFEYEKLLPGDEEFLGQAIQLHKPHLYRLPVKYNCLYDSREEPDPIITHFSGGMGKIQIMETLPKSYFQGIGLPKKKKVV